MVSVVAELTRSYFELRGNQQRLAVAQRNVANQSETLELTRRGLEGGTGTELDTSRASAQLSATRASIPPLQAAVARAIHRIGVLVGREPGALLAELFTAGGPASSARDGGPWAIPHCCCAAARTSVFPSASWPRPPRASASRWPICSPRVTFTGSLGYAATSFR